MVYIKKHTLFLVLLLSLLSSCLFKESKTTADDAYNQKHYALAVELYKASIDSESPTYAIDAYRLGNSYTELMDFDNAIRWYEKAYDANDESKVGFAYANMLYKTGDYQAALILYEYMITSVGENPKMRRKIEACKEAIRWNQDNTESVYKVSNSALSSPNTEYSPIYTKEGIVYSTDRNESFGDEDYPWTGESFSDFFLYDDLDNKPYDIGINTENNEGSIVFSKNEKEIIFVRCGIGIGNTTYCKMMVSYLEDEYWTEPVYLKFFDEEVNEIHPCLIESDSVLVFAANPLDSKGGYDLYYSVRDKDGWTSAYAMPDYLNTEGDELFPTSHNDTLYFSSDYLIGLGGMDIFKTYLKENNKWHLAENLRAPINSSFDDFGLVVDPDFLPNPIAVQSGLFCSNRVGGRGKDDIYRYVKTKPTNIPKEETIDSSFNLFVLIKVLDQQGDPISTASLSQPYGGVKTTNESGRYFFVPEKNMDYFFIVSKNGYLNKSIDIKINPSLISNLESDSTINYTLILDEYQTNKEIVLENIYYDFDKYNLRNEAMQSLDELVILLNDNPDKKIELAAHTDCKGTIDYNIELSQNRAQSVMKYLISKGISSNRLKAKGYGESVPIIACDPCDTCSESSLQTNRRTSFKFID